MRYLLSLIISFVVTGPALSQTDSTYFLKEIGMYIKVPVSFEIVPPEEDKAIKDKGEIALEEANGIDADGSSTKTLISFRQGKFNYVNINITPFKETKPNDWKENNDALKVFVYKSFDGKVPPQNIDTASADIIIDGLKLNRFVMNVKFTSEVTMKMVMLSRLYKGYDFGITYVSANDLVCKEMEEIIYQSKFKK
jgi:hypothetical protein